MAMFYVTTANNKTIILNVNGLDNDTSHYEPWWLIKHSPLNYPDSLTDYAPAGSTVINPTMVKPNNSCGITVLECRQNVNYVVKAIRDMDKTMHFGRHIGLNSPVPHWNFKILQTIRYEGPNEITKKYQIHPNADAHVPECEWIDINLEVNGIKWIKNERFYWEKPEKSF